MPHYASPPVADRTQAVLLDLYQRALDCTEPELHQAAVEAAVALTQSEIGYLHLLNESQETIESGTWSAATRRQCNAEYERHYPMSAAGVWADSARHRAPQIHNDYQGRTAKPGYPEGHVHLVRHLGVPAVEGEHVRLLIGVGNKPLDYDDHDVVCVQAIADHTWTLIRHYRQKVTLAVADRHLREVASLTATCVWDWDPEDDRLVFDANLRSVLGLPPGHSTRFTLETFLRFIDSRDHERLSEALRSPVLELELRALRADARPVVLRLRGSAYPRSQGHGLVLRGLLQAVTEPQSAPRPLGENQRDALTGLASHTALMTAVARLLDTLGPPDTEAAATSPDPDPAFLHFIRLHGWESVRDAYGRAVGDRVLQVVAQRLRSVTHASELVARTQATSFAVLESPGDASSGFAAKVVAALEAPMEVDGLVVRLRASVGAVRMERHGTAHRARACQCVSMP